MHCPDLNFSTSRVVVVGDVMLDRYWRGPCSRISPEAPVPVVNVTTIEDRPGGAANVAVNIAELGGQVSLIGVTGADEAAQILAGLLSARGINSDLHCLEHAATITKLRVLSQNQQLLRLDFEQDVLQQLDPAPLLTRLQQHLPAAGAVVLSDYNKGVLRESAQVQALIAAAQSVHIPVLVDPKGQDFSRYKHATVLTPNFAELQAVVGACADEDSLECKSRQLLADLDLDAVLITRSERGMTLIPRNDSLLHLPAQVREVYDVTGAGDTVIAVLAASLAADRSVTLVQAMALANLAAGLVVAKLGTASVSCAELRQALLADRTIVSEAELIELSCAARRRGEKIVLTNGCFDLLHAGHVAYLLQAKRLGDRLIVAVNDDASVNRLKGPARPLNPWPDRAQVLAGLASVDWVVGFSEDTPERLISALRPDVLVKGGDYCAEDIAGADCVRAAGGEVVILDYLDGRSTSTLLQRIQATPMN